MVVADSETGVGFEVVEPGDHPKQGSLLGQNPLVARLWLQVSRHPGLPGLRSLSRCWRDY